MVPSLTRKRCLLSRTFYRHYPYTELRSGYAEIIKHALISNEALWKKIQNIKNLKTVAWSELLYESIVIKNTVVLQDPHEAGLRKILNFGHTIGHAIEGYYLSKGEPILHGEAVAAGMLCEVFISHTHYNFPKNDFVAICNYIHYVFGEALPQMPDFETLLPFLKRDKKRHAESMQFVLLHAIGEPFVASCNVEIIRDSVEWYVEMKNLNQLRV